MVYSEWISLFAGVGAGAVGTIKENIDMPTTYTTINGVIVHEDRNGVQRNYRPDTNGNTIALTDAIGVTDTMTYWPFGEIRTRTGTNATRFLFVGTLGYSKDGGFGLHYVRARHYMASRGRWMTVDPLWPRESAYGYVDGRPISLIDPSGFMPYYYGKYCGEPNGPGDPIDSLDRCCMNHDYCLATFCDFIIPGHWKWCECKMCTCTYLALLNCKTLECFIKGAMINRYACLMCSLVPGPPIPIPIPGTDPRGML